MTVRTVPRRRNADLARSVADALVLWVASRVLFEAIALVVRAVVGHATSTRPGFFGLLYQWDSGWFGCIAAHGYRGAGCVGDPVGARPSFFPGYPVIGRGVAWLVGGGRVDDTTVTLGLWLLAQLAALVAAIALHRLAADRFDLRVARASTALLLFGPYAVFLVASYSERLFLAFGISAALAATRRHWWLAGLLGAGASFTRVNGLFLAGGLVVLYLVDRRRAGAPVRVRDLAGLLVSVVGAVAYLGWLRAVTGRWDSFFRAQEDYFLRRTQWPWSTLRRSLVSVVHEGRADHLVQRILELVAAAVLVWCIIVLVRRAEWAAATFVLLTMASLMTSNSYLSLARNTLTLFPLFVMGGAAVVHTRHPWRVRAVLALAAVITLVNAVQLSRGAWAD